uniref:Putative LOV domain-containing protein n=1 Tax=Tetraselmis cordiformis TaxID=426497 RepID=A0A126WW44_9CHLO|nr:putative LOV domain-containing protein [Tetraselmis cordiformis]
MPAFLGPVEVHPADALGSAPVDNVLSKIGHTFVVSDPTLPDCPVIFASDSFLRLVGYSREEVLGHNCRFLQGDETDKAAVRQLRKAVTQAKSITVRLINYKKSGEPFWNLLTLSPVKNAAGQVIKIVGVQIDITSKPAPESVNSKSIRQEIPIEAKLTTGVVQAGILQAEDPLSLAACPKYNRMDSLDHTFVVSDPTLPDCPIVFASERFFHLTGFEKEEVLGRNCRFLQGPRTDRNALVGMKEVFMRGNTASCRILNYKKSGEPFWNLLTITPIKDQMGNVTNLIGILIDVTAITEGETRASVEYAGRAMDETHTVMQEIATTLNDLSKNNAGKAPAHARQSLMMRLSQQLHLAPKMKTKTITDIPETIGKPRSLNPRLPRIAMDLATTVERMDHAFAVCDPGMEECPIVFTSDAFGRLLGIPKELVLGRHPTIIMGPEAETAGGERLKLALSTQEEKIIKIDAYHSSGQPFRAQVNLFPMLDVDAHCRFMVVVLVNISQGSVSAQDAEVQFDSETISAVLHGTVHSANPFQEVDNASGIVRQRTNTMHDMGYLLLMEATLDKSLDLSLFQLVKVLGSGASGQVMLMQLGDTGHCFAIKSVSKQDMISRNKVTRVLAEDRILASIDHPFLALCYGTITTPTHIHYVMRNCEGGDMYSLMNTNGELKEEHVRFYAAEVLVALSYLHLLGFLYRDLKPENLLLSEGHIVLTDFDLAYTRGVTIPTIERTIPDAVVNAPDRVEEQTSCGCGPACAPLPEQQQADIIGKYTRLVANPKARANSFVGTQEYLAPEIIKGSGHSAPVDWWSFGILCYELAFGFTPFRDRRRDETFYKIVNSPLTFPENKPASADFKDLLEGLLCKDPEKRLGTTGGAGEIQAHPFFATTNWALLQHYKAPFCEPIRRRAESFEMARAPSGISSDPKFHF